MSKKRPVRERAARALCQFEGHAPDIKMDGAPMWASYLPEVDVVLKAALGSEALEAMKVADNREE